MTSDRTSHAIALALAVQAAAAARTANPCLARSVVQRIRARSERTRRTIALPAYPEVDDEIRNQAARNGHEDGISSELEAELRRIEDEDADDAGPTRS